MTYLHVTQLPKASPCLQIQWVVSHMDESCHARMSPIPKHISTAFALSRLCVCKFRKRLQNSPHVPPNYCSVAKNCDRPHFSFLHSLQCVVLCCSCEDSWDALSRKSFPAVCCSVLQCVAVCCSVLQCVVVCCSVLQCVTVCCSVIQWRRFLE